MKQYNIYVSPLGGREAVKLGWSWTGFFFVWIWCFVTKLNVHGVGILIINISLGYFEIIGGDLFKLIGWGVAAIILIWLGSEGNKLREKNLLKRGYEKQSSNKASSPEGALALYAKEHNKES